VLDPSGQAAPGQVPGWSLQLVESFGTPAPTGQFTAVYGSRLGVYPDGWKDTSKNGTYSPSKVISVHDGTMDYYVRTENGVHLVAAVTPKLPSGTGQSYGRYAVRFRNEAIPGYKSAWLLWPDSERWPADGEIDFPEGDLDTAGPIKAYMHYASQSGGQDRFVSTTPMVSGWHTAVTEWSPGAVTFILDGVVLGTSTTKVPTNPMHWVLQTETNLDGYVPADDVAGHVYVDWVAQYSRVS
jgi:beta-glucanase (GH16 family)